MHRRTATKLVMPGLYDCWAGGVVGPGEDPAGTAARELAEELGVTGVPLTRLFTLVYDEGAGGLRSHLFAFEARFDGPVRHQPEEVGRRVVDAGPGAAGPAGGPGVAVRAGRPDARASGGSPSATARVREPYVDGVAGSLLTVVAVDRPDGRVGQVGDQGVADLAQCVLLVAGERVEQVRPHRLDVPGRGVLQLGQPGLGELGERAAAVFRAGLASAPSRRPRGGRRRAKAGCATTATSRRAGSSAASGPVPRRGGRGSRSRRAAGPRRAGAGARGGRRAGAGR